MYFARGKVFMIQQLIWILCSSSASAVFHHHHKNKFFRSTGQNPSEEQ